MKRAISVKTVLPPYGLVTISGEVARDRDFDPITEGCTASPFAVYDLKVIESPLHNRNDITNDLDDYEAKKCTEVLIEKFIDDEQSYQDTLVDEAIERGREYKHLAYA